MTSRLDLYTLRLFVAVAREGCAGEDRGSRKAPIAMKASR